MENIIVRETWTSPNGTPYLLVERIDDGAILLLKARIDTTGHIVPAVGTEVQS